MAYPVYYVPAGDVLPIFFSTYGKTNGESITLTGLAVTDVEIYRDGSVTQRASDAGYTLLDTDGIDFDAITGIHGFSIDTGDNTDAGFYTTGAWFHVVVSAVTVDSQTVNFIAAAFRIMEAENAAGVPDVNVTHFGGTAGTFAAGIPSASVASGGIATTSFAAGAIDAAAIAAAAITSSEAPNLDAAISSRATPAQVNTEVLDVLNVDTFAEPGQEAPPATTTLVKKIGYLYKLARNKITQTSTTLSVFADDAATVDQKATVSDDGTTYTRGEIGTGP
jgi:hypothetical protein